MQAESSGVAEQHTDGEIDSKAIHFSPYLGEALPGHLITFPHPVAQMAQLPLVMG